MPHALAELLADRPDVLTIGPNEKTETALAHMTRHDYSQLPVLDQAGTVRGLITYESMMRAVKEFNCGIQDLQVSAAMVKAEKIGLDNDLLDLLPIMERSGSALIVDNDNRLLGIITSYDVMDYFRGRAENMMLVEDIETMVRDLILYAFTDHSGNTDEGKLSAAIRAVNGQREDLRKKFKRGMANYVQRAGDESAKLNVELANQSFEVMLPEEAPRKFEDLTLNEFIDLLCSSERWHAVYRPLLGMAAQQVRGLLEQVRDIRNTLAHFRRDITPAEHDRLVFCADWLSNNMPAAPTRKQSRSTVEEAGTVTTDGASVEEVVDAGESRYALLAIWLSKLTSKTKDITLQFDQIEAIIGGPLPPSAREHRAWWANDTVGHAQSKQWLDAGWRTSYINLTDERVVFVRIKGRESAYIAFFATLIEKVRLDGRTSIKGRSPDGHPWYAVLGLPVGGRQVASLNVSFAVSKRVRVEIYIDTRDQTWNKAAFDRLHSQAGTLEAEVGEPLHWERLDAARASRVACYRPGSITETADHEALQAWAVEMLARFSRVLVPATAEALKDTRGVTSK